MRYEDIESRYLFENVGQIEGVGKNPRFANSKALGRLRASIEESPELLEYKALIVYEVSPVEYVVLCGNHRLKSAKGARDTFPCVVLDNDVDVETIADVIRKDNFSFGHWIDSELRKGWTAEELERANIVFTQKKDYESPDFRVLTIMLEYNDFINVTGCLREAGDGDMSAGLLELLKDEI